MIDFREKLAHGRLRGAGDVEELKPAARTGSADGQESALAELPLTLASPGEVVDPRTTAEALYASWLGGRSAQTRRAYAKDLATYADFMAAESPTAALAGLLRGG